MAKHAKLVTVVLPETDLTQAHVPIGHGRSAAVVPPVTPLADRIGYRPHRSKLLVYHMRLTPEQIAALEQIAKEKNITASELAREMIAEGISQLA